jgi:hypothetical protein
MRDLEPKPKTLINLVPKDFETDWRRAAATIERALDLVEHVGPDGFGVFNRSGFPATASCTRRAAKGEGVVCRNDARATFWRTGPPVDARAPCRIANAEDWERGDGSVKGGLPRSFFGGVGLGGP